MNGINKKLENIYISLKDTPIVSTKIVDTIEDDEQYFTIMDLIDQYGESFILNQLITGIDVETEHTDDLEVAFQIAVDHVCEIPDYYSRLLGMESESEKVYNDDLEQEVDVNSLQEDSILERLDILLSSYGFTDNQSAILISILFSHDALDKKEERIYKLMKKGILPMLDDNKLNKILKFI